ncbi:MAG: glycosyltransferase family 2 protein [Nodosilinea sp.]
MSLTFSVITPSYNQGEFIERTIQSVLAQTGVDFEYVVLDGGSVDTTLEILNQYQNRLTWVSEPDDGQADAVNKGIQATSGNIIAWINSDDVYYPEALKKVEQTFLTHPDVQVVYGRANWIGKNDEVLREYPTEVWNYERLKAFCYLCQPAVFFRRTMVERLGDLDKALRYALDYELWLRYGQAVDFYYIPEKLAGSRLYSTNKTIGQSLEARTEIKTMLSNRLGTIPADWLLGYALVKVEKTFGISRFDCNQTHRFVSLLIKLSLIELYQYNPVALVRIAPKMVFWVLFPNRAWFRREEGLDLS